ncbi:SusD/RagB family nutrient-binding outer membrane lipoprotein [Carboxylicivirga sp. N1Y90]|uniref:SusD/RagB family nutrient-binding outer membrane lipoprotein n=1 Tax=Carboxylicivirga fragile TaxID=3417571 RepID=UPI003D3479BB|nr:SusD/RagB family nutrient-binding outer membrane lipoprotein [Marinilabiliaceae bacterium N1Y90]
MKKYYILFITALLMLNACNKVELEEVDPNNFADSSPDLMINGPMLANTLVVEGELARMANIFTNQFTGADRQYISFNSYNVTAGDFDNIWGTTYADGIGQCRLIRDKAIAIKEVELEGVAMIVEASLAGTAASVWGDIPFTEAGNKEMYPQPKFDKQLDVYIALQDLLDVAITKVGDLTYELSKENPNLGKVYEAIDPAYRDALMWKEVAYSLKAKFYLIVGDYANANAYAKMGIASASGDWMAYHPGDSYPNNISGAQNIYFDFCAWNRDGYMDASDAYLPSVLTSRNDPRMDHYYIDWWTADGSLYPYAWTGGIFDAGSPFPVVTYYEMQLIIAETELIANSDAGAALTALNNVRTYWRDRYGEESDYPAYVAGDFADDAALLTEILTEKYMSMYGQIGAFDDIRRTGNYLNIPLKTGQSELPQRFVYPQSEIDSNGNTPKVENIFVKTEANSGVYPGV